MAKKINDNSENATTIDILEQAKNINQQTHNYIDWNQKTGHMLSDKSFSDTETLENDWGSFGQSSHDNTSFNPNYKSGDLNEMRAADQGFVEKVGLGATKLYTTAASTFLDNTVGFLWGVGSAVVNGDASKVWDNDFTNAMQDFNEWCDEQMPHYSSQYEGYGLDFWGNFIGKVILQNAGFQVGTGLSMLVPGAFMKVPGQAIKGTKLLSNFLKTGKAIRTGNAAKDLVLGTYAAIGESTIEALQNKRDFVKYQEQVADDEFRQKQQELDYEWRQVVNEKYNGDENAARRSMDFNDYFNKSQELKAERQQKQQFIEREADKVGDMTFMATLVIVGGTNFTTFGKAFTGYNLSKRFADVSTNIVDKESKEILRKNVSNRAASKAIKDGKIKVKNPNYHTYVKDKNGKLVYDENKYIEKAVTVEAAAKSKSPAFHTVYNLAKEGFEEMNQSVASEYSTGIAEQDMLNYEALAESGMAYEDILQNINDTWFSYGQFAKSLNKVYTDPQQWRQFFSGAIGGVLSPHFTRGTDGKLKFKLSTLGEQIASINAQNSTNAYIAEQINKQLNSEEAQNYITGLIRHKALDNSKNYAVTQDSKMDYENADFAQFVSDITMMSNAGKLDLLRAHLDSMRNLTDDELEKVCMQMCEDVKVKTKSGKIKTKKTGDFVDINGNYKGNTEQARMDIRKKINDRIDKLQKDINLYQSTMNEIDSQTGGVLDIETLGAFTWEKANLMNKYNRAYSIIGSTESVKNLGVYKDHFTSLVASKTRDLETKKNELKLEKDKLSRQPKVEGKPVEASEMQKSLEKDIEILTSEITKANELSQLLSDMEALQVANSNHNDDKTGIQKLFDKYSDFAESLPELAKDLGLFDEKGERVKGRDMSLEKLMYYGAFDKFMKDISKADNAEDFTDDYRDAAMLFRRAIMTEQSLDKLIADPTQFTGHRAELQQKILEHENSETVEKIQKEIEKQLDEGTINFNNLEEESKKITDGIINANINKRGLFQRAVNAMRNTPYDELRLIAIRNVLKNAKYKNLVDMRNLVNYVYHVIGSKTDWNDAQRQVAMNTFNKLIEGKKTVNEIFDKKININDVDEKPILVEVSDTIKQNRLNALRNNHPDLPYNKNTYQYTEQSVTAANIAKNEIPQVINQAISRFKAVLEAPKLLEQLSNGDTSSLEENAQESKGKANNQTQRKQIDSKKESIIKGVEKLIATYKEGQVLSTDEEYELRKKAVDLIDKTFNSEEFDEEFATELEQLRDDYRIEALNMVDENIKDRINVQYDEKNIDEEISRLQALENEKSISDEQRSKLLGLISEKELKEVRKAINKELEKISNSLNNSYKSECFNDVFDNIAIDDKSQELSKSTEGYYLYNNNVYRGNLAKCDYNGEQHYAVCIKNKGQYDYLVINRQGRVIAKHTTNGLIPTTKDKPNIDLNKAKATNAVADLTTFRNLDFLIDTRVLTNAEKRDRTKRRKIVSQIIRNNGLVDEKGNINLKNNLLSTVVASNVIMNSGLTKSTSDIETVAETAEEISTPKNKQRTEIQYYIFENKDGEMLRVKLPARGNRILIKDENGNTTEQKFSKSLYKKKGIEGVIKEIYGDDVQIVKSSLEDWNGKQETVKQEETKPTVVVQSTSQPKVEVRKIQQVKRKRAVKTLEEQLSELDNMMDNLQAMAERNPEYHQSLNTVETFRLYVQLVKDNYEQLGSKKVVLDSNTVQTIVDKLKNNLKKIFGDKVEFKSDEEIKGQKDNYTQLSKYDGEIYGYTTNGGIVINKDKFRLDTPVHEYTHIWDSVVQKEAPELWKRGVELMKDTSEWEKVVNDPNYADIKDDENKVASEVHSRLSGMIAAGKTIELAAKDRTKSKKNFWQKLIDWFKEFKDFTLRNVFGMKAEDAKKVTLDQFLNAPVADFFMGTNPNDIGKSDIRQENVDITTTTQQPTNNTNLNVGDTVQYGIMRSGSFNAITNNAVVQAIDGDNVTIEYDGKKVKTKAKYLRYLYGEKPSKNALKGGNAQQIISGLDDAVSAEEYVARYLAGSNISINDTKKDIDDLKIASKNGSTIDDIVSAIKDEMPFNLEQQDIRNIIIDIASGRNKNDIARYAVEAHYAAQDKEWEAQVSEIQNRLQEGETTETDIDNLTNDELIEIFGTDAISDEELAEILSEEDYQEYLRQRADEESLSEEERQRLEQEQADELDEEAYQEYLQQRAAELGELPDEVRFIVDTTQSLNPPIDVTVINDGKSTDVLKKLDEKSDADRAAQLDVFSPSISEYSIDDKTKTSLEVLEKKYPDADFSYIYNLYKASGAFDYVKEAQLKKDDTVYIGIGVVGFSRDGKQYPEVVFMVKDDKGDYRFIGSLRTSSRLDPSTAAELSNQVKDMYVSNRSNFKEEKIKMVKAAGQFKIGDEKSFHILAPNGNPVTTTVSKILNGSLIFSEDRHSLKEVTLNNGKSIEQTIKDGELENVRIGYLDGGLNLVENYVADDSHISIIEGFRNINSKRPGRIVMLFKRPDGKHQMIPLNIAQWKDIFNSSNPIATTLNEILYDAYTLYTNQRIDVFTKNSQLSTKGGIMSRLHKALHIPEMLLIYEPDGAISVALNDKRNKYKNADGRKPRPKSFEEFVDVFRNVFGECLINVNSEVLKDKQQLGQYILSDIFTTNLTSTEFHNAYYTVKPIDATGTKKKSDKDMPEQYKLKENELNKVYPEKVCTYDGKDIYLAEDNKGKLDLYMRDEDTFNKNAFGNNTSTSKRLLIMNYAKLKNGIAIDTNRKDSIKVIDGKECLVHPTDDKIYGTRYYDVSNNFKDITEDITSSQKKKDDIDAEIEDKKARQLNPKDTKKAKELFGSEKFLNKLKTIKPNLLDGAISNIPMEKLSEFDGNMDKFSRVQQSNIKYINDNFGNEFGKEIFQMLSLIKQKYKPNFFKTLFERTKNLTGDELKDAIDKVFKENLIQDNIDEALSTKRDYC